MELNEDKEGLEFSKRALDIDPNHLNALGVFAKANYKLGKHEDSVAACDKCLDIKPSLEAFKCKGIALFKLARWKEVVDTADKVLSDASNFNKSEGFEQYKNALQRLKNEALKHLSPQQPLPANGQPSSPPSTLTLPLAPQTDTGSLDHEVEIKSFDDALAVCDKILNLNPYKTAVFLLKCRVLSKLGRWEEVVKTADQILGDASNLNKYDRVELHKNQYKASKTRP